jgi:hypothetical protein
MGLRLINMKTEGFGTIRYGELRFIFEMTESVSKFLASKGISPDSMFPKTQFFYQGVLMKTGVSHEEEKELTIIFNAIRIGDEGVKDILEGDYERFDNFPMHDGDDIYFTEFGVEVK